MASETFSDSDEIEKGDRNATGSFGLLFDTFVPISSILTVSIVVGFTIPKHEYFGLFWLIWWALAVVVSLQSVDDDHHNENRGGPFSSEDRMKGLFVLLGLPTAMLLSLFVWWKKIERRLRPKQQGWLGRGQQFLQSIRPIRGFVLHNVPLWSMIAIHIYRLDGLSVVMSFWKGKVPNFVGYQTIVLDVIMGVTAIPLTYRLYVPRKRSVQWSASTANSWANRKKSSRQSKRVPFLRDALWFWNSLGLYDLCSAYLVFVLNVFGFGGPHIAEPPLLPELGKHPLPLLILFQVPLAIAVHILMLTNMDELIREYEKQVQSSTDLSLELPTTVGTGTNRP